MDTPIILNTNSNNPQLYSDILVREMIDIVDSIAQYYSENSVDNTSIRGNEEYTKLLDRLSIVTLLTKLCNSSEDSKLYQVFKDNFNKRNNITFQELSEQVKNKLK